MKKSDYLEQNINYYFEECQLNTVVMEIDSRYAAVRPEMDCVFFIPFPKPKTQREKCERMVRLCGRKYFGVDNVNKDKYMCSKHFVGGNGPSIDHPDPLPASATDYEVRVLSSKRKRKSPAQRSTLSFSKSRKTTKPVPNSEVEVPSMDDEIAIYCESNGSCTGMFINFKLTDTINNVINTWNMNTWKYNSEIPLAPTPACHNIKAGVRFRGILD